MTVLDESPAHRQTSRRRASINNDPSLGAVFTRPWVANLVLDAAGYTAANDLAAGTAVEPSCGSGAFLTPMIDRLANSCALHGHDLARATNAIRAWDLDSRSVTQARITARQALMNHGVPAAAATRLAKRWINEGDFLLQPPQAADWVVGNPPYVRLEDVPTERSNSYRRRWTTMQGRADVYVGFIEAGLRMLNPGGTLAFICADRWMRNQYGKHLRQLIEAQFAMRSLITLHDSDVFENQVAAYPAIFAISNSQQGPALIVDADGSFNETSAHNLVLDPRGLQVHPRPSADIGFVAAILPKWFEQSPSWPSGGANQLALVAELESRHPPLGDPSTGTALGIGLASGADAVFLTKDPDLTESERLLPMVMAGDLQDGKVVWSGTHLVNPWDNDGELVSLDQHARLRSYMEEHEDRLRSRHVGRRQPHRWYRTIDRPVGGLAEAQKLLLPDLRMRVTPVLETQGLYPHHNLFWVTSTKMDLRVLGGLLLSDFGTLFVKTYSPRMAGGALRVTAQYLRRIRVPAPSSIDPQVARSLAVAFDAHDVAAASAAAAVAYGVHPERLAALAV